MLLPQRAQFGIVQDLIEKEWLFVLNPQEDLDVRMYSEVLVLGVQVELTESGVTPLRFSVALPYPVSLVDSPPIEVMLANGSQTAPVGFVLLEGDQLESFVQATPMEANISFFDQISGAQSLDPRDLYAVAPWPSGFNEGTVLVGAVHPDGTQYCKLVVGGSIEEEVFQSASEEPAAPLGLGGELVRVPQDDNDAEAEEPPPPAGRKPRARANAAAAAKAGSRGMGDLHDKLDRFMGKVEGSLSDLSGRLAALEGGRVEGLGLGTLVKDAAAGKGQSRPRTAADVASAQGSLGRGWPAAGPPACPPGLGLGHKATAPPLLGAGFKAGLPAPAKPLGLPPPRGSGPPPAGASVLGPAPSAVGPRAFDEALRAARASLGPRAAEEAPEEPRPRAGGGTRRADVDLMAAVREGGPTAQMALQLATLEVLESLQKGKAPSDPTLDELLFGLGPPGDPDASDPVGKLAGTRGAAGLVQLARAIESDPGRWSAYCDAQAAIKCGATTTGMPWSMAFYGERCVRFENVRQREQAEIFQKVWVMFSALHALDASGQTDLMGAKLRQCLKAIEQAVAAGGSWKLAWLLTGLPDPNPRNAPGVGLVHPAEFAAAASFVREMDTLENIARREQNKPPNKFGKNPPPTGSGNPPARDE